MMIFPTFDGYGSSIRYKGMNHHTIYKEIIPFIEPSFKFLPLLWALHAAMFYRNICISLSASGYQVVLPYKVKSVMHPYQWLS